MIKILFLNFFAISFFANAGTEAGYIHRPNLDAHARFTFANMDNTEDCKSNETSVERTVVFVGEVCLRDTLSNKIYTQTPFRVFVERFESDDPEASVSIEEIFKNNNEFHIADQRGCITMSIPVKHKVFNRQKYFKVDIHFLSEKLNLYGKARLALNPWQKAFQAYLDATELEEKAIRFDAGGVDKSELIINQFKSVNLSVNLLPLNGSRIEFLNNPLHNPFYHRVDFLFQPFITRHDNVALGLDHRRREILRDGYYMVRLLILRNPQETFDLPRVFSKENLNNERDQILNERELGFEYVAHTDRVVKVEANSVNLYVPLYLTNRQLGQLYNVSSRNLISIEIVPVDPSGFVFKEVRDGRACELDLDGTEWKPFFDHELINYPYVGAFSVDNWTNWNMLRPLNNLDSDTIIEQSEIGREYRHFDLRRSEQSVFKGFQNHFKFMSIPRNTQNP